MCIESPKVKVTGGSLCRLSRSIEVVAELHGTGFQPVLQLKFPSPGIETHKHMCGITHLAQIGKRATSSNLYIPTALLLCVRHGGQNLVSLVTASPGIFECPVKRTIAGVVEPELQCSSKSWMGGLSENMKRLIQDTYS